MVTTVLPLVNMYAPAWRCIPATPPSSPYYVLPHHLVLITGHPCKFEAEAVFGWCTTHCTMEVLYFSESFLKKLCYTLTTNLTGLIETKSSGSDYISLYHVQSTLISKSKFHRLVSETDQKQMDMSDFQNWPAFGQQLKKICKQSSSK